MAVTPNPARLAAAVAAVRWNDLLGGLVPEILHQLHFVILLQIKVNVSLFAQRLRVVGQSLAFHVQKIP